MKLKLWRSNLSVTKGSGGIIELDNTPNGYEEESNLFNHEVENLTDLNSVIISERVQDMNERVLFADRAFCITLGWVGFLIVLPILQMIFSIWGKGLSDSQFITVVTTTTGAVFGFWHLVGRYLFQSNKDNDKT